MYDGLVYYISLAWTIVLTQLAECAKSGNQGCNSNREGSEIILMLPRNITDGVKKILQVS